MGEVDTTIPITQTPCATDAPLAKTAGYRTQILKRPGSPEEKPRISGKLDYNTDLIRQRNLKIEIKYSLSAAFGVEDPRERFINTANMIWKEVFGPVPEGAMTFIGKGDIKGHNKLSKRPKSCACYSKTSDSVTFSPKVYDFPFNLQVAVIMHEFRHRAQIRFIKNKRAYPSPDSYVENGMLSEKATRYWLSRAHWYDHYSDEKDAYLIGGMIKELPLSQGFFTDEQKDLLRDTVFMTARDSKAVFDRWAAMSGKKEGMPSNMCSR